MLETLREACLIPGLGRSPGEGNGNLLQYSCLENPMDRGAWWTAVRRVIKSRRGLKRLSMQACTKRKNAVGQSHPSGPLQVEPTVRDRSLDPTHVYHGTHLVRMEEPGPGPALLLPFSSCSLNHLMHKNPRSHVREFWILPFHFLKQARKSDKSFPRRLGSTVN